MERQPLKLLKNIDSPSDLRGLAPETLPALAEEIRALILDVISEKGGHFASNLGTVELAIALHYVFETPQDKLVWDVGHQAYPHKILTGRRDRFSTVRQHEGISGFLDRRESKFDHFGAGHASTSISAALGMAEAMRHGGDPRLSIAVIGDGSMTGGLAFEALNHAGHIPAKNLVVVLNDNNMSIDPNVGALQKFLNHRVAHPGYNLFRRELRSVLSALDAHGVPLGSLASRFRKSVKNLFTAEMLYECLGFRYFGPIDGHSLEDLLETFQFIREEGVESGPYLIHAITTKGKGYLPAEENALKYHGVTPFKVEDGVVSKPKKLPNYQDVFADTLIELAKEDPRIVAVTAAMPSGTGVVKFQKEFPGRTYDVGIAEQHAVLFCAGLATEGYRPVAAIYSTFLQRSFDQIIHDVGLQNLPVFFALDRAGVVGADGATHQGQFDLTYLRCVPNFVVMAPKDENELRHMIRTGVEHRSGPIAVRYPRGAVVGVPADGPPRVLPIGKGELLFSDSGSPDVTLVAVGYSVQSAVEAADRLRKEGLKVALINARFIKPLDTELIEQWAANSKVLATVEENALAGGFGSAVLEHLSDRGISTSVVRIGLPDRFIDHAPQPTQRKTTGVDGVGIASKVLARLNVQKKKTPQKIATPESFTRPLPLQ